MKLESELGIAFFGSQVSRSEDDRLSVSRVSRYFQQQREAVCPGKHDTAATIGKNNSLQRPELVLFIQVSDFAHKSRVHL